MCSFESDGCWIQQKSSNVAIPNRIIPHILDAISAGRRGKN
jgi:hypothetical protein